MTTKFFKSYISDLEPTNHATQFTTTKHFGYHAISVDSDLPASSDKRVKVTLNRSHEIGIGEPGHIPFWPCF